MVVGVVGFYFLLSDINAVISEALNKEARFSAKLSMLEKVNIRYKLSPDTYKEARASLFRLADRTKLDLLFFYGCFPTHIREELKHAQYSAELAQFPLFRKLKPEQLNRIGDALQLEVFEESRLDQTSSSSKRTSPRTRSICWPRAA